MPLNGFIRIVISKYKNYMVTIWFAYGENITFWTQFPNKIKKNNKKGKRVYICESRMEIKVGQIDSISIKNQNAFSLNKIVKLFLSIKLIALSDKHL